MCSWCFDIDTQRRHRLGPGLLPDVANTRRENRMNSARTTVVRSIILTAALMLAANAAASAQEKIIFSLNDESNFASS